MARKKEEKDVEAVEEKVGFSVLGVYVNNVLIPGGRYEVSVHGTRTKEYAEEFAKKRGGEVRKIA